MFRELSPPCCVHDQFSYPPLDSFATVSVLEEDVGPRLHVDMPPYSSIVSGSSPSSYGSACSSPSPSINHPSGLDAPQIGIEFVLSLEQRCLGHAQKSRRSKFRSGHALTAHAPLLTRAPKCLDSNTKWQVPVVEIERMLQMTWRLNMSEEITPLQAWSRIRSHSRFLSWDMEDLETFRLRLTDEVRCHGFGAVIDKSTFEELLENAFSHQSSS